MIDDNEAPDDRAEKTRRMKALSEDDRRAMIDAAPNCVGYDRFKQRERQVALRDGYRKPQKPGPGGQA